MRGDLKLFLEIVLSVYVKEVLKSQWSRKKGYVIYIYIYYYAVDIICLYILYYVDILYLSGDHEKACAHR